MNISFWNDHKLTDKSAKIYHFYYCKTVKVVFDNEEPKEPNENTVKQIIQYFEDNKDMKNSVKIGMLNSFRKKIELSKNEQAQKATSDIEKELTKLNQNTMYKPPTQKEKDNKIDLEYIVKMREHHKAKLKNEFCYNDVYFLFCSLYSYQLPLRSQDYYNTKILTQYSNVDKEADNYYDPESKTLILNEYKTKATHGARLIKMPDELHNIIMDFNNKSKNEFLICSARGNKLTAVTFNQLAHRALDKEISSSLLRKCILSNKIDIGMDADERKEASAIMGHSLGTQQLIYSSLSDSIHVDSENLEYWLRRYKTVNQQIEIINENIIRLLDEKITKNKDVEK